MKKHILLVGDRQVGKSTLVGRLIMTIEKPIYGFCTRTMSDDENGFHSVYIYPATGMHLSGNSEHNLIGISNRKERTVFPEIFDELGVKLLRANPDGIIVMDELGFMEENAEAFKARVLELFDGDIPILATTKSTHRPSDFLDKIKSHPNAEIYEISEGNRDDLYYTLRGRYDFLK